MKKTNLLGILAMVSMLFTTSCSQDDLQNDPLTSDFINATFTLGTDDVLGSRAIGDGSSVDKVACAVYDAQGAELTELYQIVDIDGTTEDGKRKATFSTRLAKGHNYRVAFFAYKEDANAYNVEDLKNIKVNPGQSSNNEGRDAFTAYYDVETGKTMNVINETVTLKRPFAQLNLGINDEEKKAAENAGIIVEETKIVVSNVYNAFSAYDDEVVANAEVGEMVFELNAIPKEKLIINDQKYNYLAMNYLLVGNKGSEKSLTDVKFIYKTTNGITNNPVTSFDNIPVQRNYRTNIVGRLLTTPAEFTLLIDNSFDGTKPALWEPVDVNTWDEFTAAVTTIDPTCQYIRLCSDIEYTGNYSLKNNVTIDLDGKSITMPMFYVFNTATIKNGTINGKMYARTGCNVTLEGLTFSGTISDDLSTEGHLQVQGGCDVYAKDCVFAATTVNGSQTRSLSIEGSSSGTRKFENCDFKFLSFGTGAGKYKKNVYINTMSGTTTVDFTNCKLNGKAPNILFAGTYSLANLTMSGCDNTGPTLETNRAKDAITDAEWAHISSLIANNKFTQVRLFYAGGSSEYIK